MTTREATDGRQLTQSPAISKSWPSLFLAGLDATASMGELHRDGFSAGHVGLTSSGRSWSRTSAREAFTVGVRHGVHDRTAWTWAKAGGCSVLLLSRHRPVRGWCWVGHAAGRLTGYGCALGLDTEDPVALWAGRCNVHRAAGGNACCRAGRVSRNRFSSWYRDTR